jgi:hypothetical protein
LGRAQHSNSNITAQERIMARSNYVQVHEADMEFVDIPGTQLHVSRVALGTWAMGGWMWGGTDERESVKTIWGALDQGINLIDTAPAYGSGVSEEIVGKAVASANLRARTIIATKAGLEMRDGKAYRNATRQRILREVNDSLRRLRTDYIDIYQVHWPDPLVPIEETAEAMRGLYDLGKIRAIGVSNFSVTQMERFRQAISRGYGSNSRGKEPVCWRGPRWGVRSSRDHPPLCPLRDVSALRRAHGRSRPRLLRSHRFAESAAARMS